MLFAWLRRRRRRRLLLQPFPAAWEDTLANNFFYYSYLTPPEQARLRDDLRIFIAEKHWEGCDGLVMTDEIKVTIAAQACVLLLGMEHDYFSRVLTILVYKSAFHAQERHSLGGAELVEEDVSLSGLAHYRGVVVLVWKDVRRAGRRPHGGANLVWHEFAHQLDMLDRSLDGTPPLKSLDQRRRWQEVMTAEYNQLVADSESGRPTLLDEYGASNEAEFFAVATECFFDLPGPMRQEHPRLYALLAEFYCQDPAERVPPEAYEFA
jgi:Mlc titration factor MtfA (ptsG expression regulator)